MGISMYAQYETELGQQERREIVVTSLIGILASAISAGSVVLVIFFSTVIFAEDKQALQEPTGLTTANCAACKN
jgi:hypothetical protein